jgi:hypothetical protein
MAVLSELLDDNMQTYEEFRLDVERHMYGESLEQVTPGDVPITPIEEVIFEAPKFEFREGLSGFSTLTTLHRR